MWLDNPMFYHGTYGFVWKYGISKSVESNHFPAKRIQEAISHWHHDKDRAFDVDVVA